MCCLSDLSRFLLPPTLQELQQPDSASGHPTIHIADHAPSIQGKIIDHSFTNSVEQGNDFLQPTQIGSDTGRGV